MVPESCDAAVVDAVLRMGDAFKLGVIAEGVETAEQEQWLIDAGCAEVQGYLHGRPMEASELTALIEQTPLSFDETITPSPHAVGL